MMGEMLCHLAGLFYMEERVNPPDQIRQNHTTYIAMDLAAGHNYLSKRYGIREFDPTEEVVERIFAGQSDCYRSNDDGGVGYAWLVPQETLSYALLKNDYGYIENGHIADLCTLAVVTTDNMRSESNHGDTAGVRAFFSVPRDGKAACGRRWFPLGMRATPSICGSSTGWVRARGRRWYTCCGGFMLASSGAKTDWRWPIAFPKNQLASSVYTR